MILDLGCGANKKPGCVGVDCCAVEGVDVVHDLFTFPWPFEDGAAEAVKCSHFFEHVPAALRPAFMREIWRVLVPGGTAEIATPLGLWRQCQDFTHEWPPIVPASYLYFNHAWVRGHGMQHYIDRFGLPDFDVSIDGLYMAEGFASLDEKEAIEAATNIMNAVDDLVVTLTKRTGPAKASAEKNG